MHRCWEIQATGKTQAARGPNETPGRLLRPRATTSAPYHPTRRSAARRHHRRGRLHNPYEFARWDRLGQRHRLDTGKLQISVLDVGVLEELEGLLVGTTLLGTTAEVRPLYTSGRLSAWRWASLARCVAGVDGELITFEAPLRFLG